MPTAISSHNIADFKGQLLGISDWLLVNQERIDLFAKATGDYQWIHVDVDRAKAERGNTIAHGFLVLSMLPVLHESIVDITDTSMILNYGLNRVRFTGEVPAGSKVRLQDRLVDVVPKQDGLLVSYEFVVEREGAPKPVIFAETLALIIPEQR